MKNEASKRQHPRPRRAERRAAERAQARQRVTRKSRISVPALVGGIGTVLVVVAILAYAALRSNNSTSATGLADPRALNPAPSMLSVGSRAPDFTLSGSYGKTYHLAAQRGHPVLLEFFAVWCPVCQGEAPTMARITRDFVPRGVPVWSILANPYGKNYELSGRSDLTLATDKDLSWFAQKFNVHHPQLVDPQFEVTNQYGVNAYPGIYVVNAQGVITHATSGRQSYAALARDLNKALR